MESETITIASDASAPAVVITQAEAPAESEVPIVIEPIASTTEIVTTAITEITATTDTIDKTATTAIDTTDSHIPTAAELQAEHERAEAKAAAAAATDGGAQGPHSKGHAKNQKNAVLDVASEEAFPSLGPASTAPVLPQKKWSQGNGLSYMGAAKISAVPIKATVTHRLQFEKHEMIPRSEMKKPLRDLYTEIEKKYNVKIHGASATKSDLTVIIMTGVEKDVSQAKRELIKDICPKVC